MSSSLARLTVHEGNGQPAGELFRLLSGDHLCQRRSKLAVAAAAVIGSGLYPFIERKQSVQFVTANLFAQIFRAEFRGDRKAFGFAAQEIAVRRAQPRKYA